MYGRQPFPLANPPFQKQNCLHRFTISWRRQLQWIGHTPFPCQPPVSRVNFLPDSGKVTLCFFGVFWPTTFKKKPWNCDIHTSGGGWRVARETLYKKRRHNRLQDARPASYWLHNLQVQIDQESQLVLFPLRINDSFNTPSFKRAKSEVNVKRTGNLCLFYDANVSPTARCLHVHVHFTLLKESRNIFSPTSGLRGSCPHDVTGSAQSTQPQPDFCSDEKVHLSRVWQGFLQWVLLQLMNAPSGFPLCFLDVPSPGVSNSLFNY